MSGPFTTLTVDRFNMLQDVYIAADRFLNCTAEFPKEPSAWGEWMEALETAVSKYKKATQ